MKKTIEYKIGDKIKKTQVSQLPIRYIFAFFLVLIEVIAMIGVVIALCLFVPYFYILAYVTAIGCVIKIISSNDSPDYKVPWILCVIVLPIVGFMLYFIFYSRKLAKSYVKRLYYLTKNFSNQDNDVILFNLLDKTDDHAKSQAKLLANTSNAKLYSFTKQTYFSSGEELWESLISDLKKAKKFIYMEYFIIEDGVFWQSILTILKEKASAGLDVRLVYDDIGCMNTLPSNYYKTLSKFKIKAVPFARLKANANNEFNNRSHRKITVIDGIIGYTGGINIADEYVNKIERFGHWKDVGIRLHGTAVHELTRLFILDYGINCKTPPTFLDTETLYPQETFSYDGFIMPFGDGPKPLYERRISKSLITTMIEQASSYCYIMTPYLIIDNEICSSIETAALRGVKVKIILPHIPDKKIVFALTQSYYERLIKAGAEIYEYAKGFIHAKVYLTDDGYAVIGTMNLDFRSLVHHFENGVWLYKAECLKSVKQDFNSTLKDCIKVSYSQTKKGVFHRFFCSILKIFAPLF